MTLARLERIYPRPLRAALLTTAAALLLSLGGGGAAFAADDDGGGGGWRDRRGGYGRYDDGVLAHRPHAYCGEAYYPDHYGYGGGRGHFGLHFNF